jgi:hypothetical protein
MERGVFEIIEVVLHILLLQAEVPVLRPGYSCLPSQYHNIRVQQPKLNEGITLRLRNSILPVQLKERLGMSVRIAPRNSNTRLSPVATVRIGKIAQWISWYLCVFSVRSAVRKRPQTGELRLCLMWLVAPVRAVALTPCHFLGVKDTWELRWTFPGNRFYAPEYT